MNILCEAYRANADVLRLRFARFFFDYQRRISQQFDTIFDPPVEESVDPNRLPGLAGAGWLHILEVMSNYDVTKFEAVLKVEASTVFGHMCYIKEKNNLESMRIQQMRNG